MHSHRDTCTCTQNELLDEFLQGIIMNTISSNSARRQIFPLMAKDIMFHSVECF